MASANDFRNPNGTYDGIALLAALSGLSEAEVRWTAARIKHLIRVEGKSPEEAKAMVKAEGTLKPWETPT